MVRYLCFLFLTAHLYLKVSKKPLQIFSLDKIIEIMTGFILDSKNWSEYTLYYTCLLKRPQKTKHRTFTQNLHWGILFCC